MIENKENIKGLVGTVVFHVLLLCLLFFFGFSQPKEIPAEKGIEINFGTTPQGRGPAEPKPQAAKSPVQPRIKPTPPPPSTPKVKHASAVKAPALLTQNVEESLEIKKQKEEKQRKKKEAEDLKKLQVQQEKQRVAKQKQDAEIARKAKAAQDARDREAALIRAQTGNAFMASGKGTQDSPGEGNDRTAGNAGSPTGGSTGSPYGSGGSGGNGFSLNGRHLQGHLPEPKKTYQETGTVVVEIEVDRTGRVTQARPILQGSSTQSAQLWKLAREAALQAKFDSKTEASAIQKGTITYHFTLE